MYKSVNYTKLNTGSWLLLLIEKKDSAQPVSQKNMHFYYFLEMQTHVFKIHFGYLAIHNFLAGFLLSIKSLTNDCLESLLLICYHSINMIKMIEICSYFNVFNPCASNGNRLLLELH